MYKLKDGDIVVKTIESKSEDRLCYRLIPLSFCKMEMIIFSFCKQASGLGNSPLDNNLSEGSSLSPKKTIYAFGQ